MIKSSQKNKIIGGALLLLQVALLAAIFFMLINSRYEDRLYDTFVSKVVKPGMSQEEKALSLLHATHALLMPRYEIWGERLNLGVRERLFLSADSELLEARWRCASLSHVLCRALQRAGFTARIAQMKSRNIWGGHVLLEAKIKDEWVALDPLYDLYFVRSDRRLASINDIRQNWEYFKKQVPVDYDESYKYEDIRYSNWGKIPVIMPLIKSVLSAFMGEENAERISLRAAFLNLYKVYAVLLSILYIFILFLSVSRMAWGRRKDNG